MAWKATFGSMLPWRVSPLSGSTCMKRGWQGSLQLNTSLQRKTKMSTAGRESMHTWPITPSIREIRLLCKIQMHLTKFRDQNGLWEGLEKFYRLTTLMIKRFSRKYRMLSSSHSWVLSHWWWVLSKCRCHIAQTASNYLGLMWWLMPIWTHGS